MNSRGFMPSRKKPQANGLYEPYTVMVQGRPYPVKARNLKEAEEKAKQQATKDGLKVEEVKADDSATEQEDNAN
jgi:hypothetical protein